MTMLILEQWRRYGKNSGPKFHVSVNCDDVPKNETFSDKSHGLFHPDSAFKSDDSVPKVIGIDPGQNNLWCASFYNESAYDT